jgi:hypothetical protein
MGKFCVWGVSDLLIRYEQRIQSGRISKKRTMKQNRSIYMLLVACLCGLQACKPDLAKQIATLEASTKTATHGNEGLSQLVALYQKAAQEAGSETKEAAEYNSKAGILLVEKLYMYSEAAQMLVPALNTNAGVTEKSRTAGCLARAYLKVREINGTDKPEDDFTTKIKAALIANRPALDSSLQHYRNKMVDKEQKLTNPQAVEHMTDLIDGYVLALGGSDELRKAELEFEAANANKAISNFARAVSFYNSVAQQKADLQKAANSQFMMAFVFENDMNSLPQAKIAYETFIKNFPDNEMADDARMSLKNLGKTPEQMLKEMTKGQ